MSKASEILQIFLEIKSTIFLKTIKLKTYEKLLYKTAIEYYLKKLGLSKLIINVKSTRGKRSKKYSGYVELSKTTDTNYDIVIDFEGSYIQVLDYLAHELIHIQQIYLKKLVKDGNKILWLGKFLMDIDTFNKVNIDKKKHASLPFEQEVNKNKKILKQKFLSSKEFIDLAEKDINLKFIVNSLKGTR